MHCTTTMVITAKYEHGEYVKFQLLLPHLIFHIELISSNGRMVSV